MFRKLYINIKYRILKFKYRIKFDELSKLDCFLLMVAYNKEEPTINHNDNCFIFNNLLDLNKSPLRMYPDDSIDKWIYYINLYR